ncbi:MAG: IS21 family transposase [Verrucomicrobiota bacterium]|nr:IS21 family transposase [Verrucomicrobiota bacterium]
MISKNIYWEIQHLNRINKLSAGQIAEKLDISENTIRKWINESGHNPRKLRGLKTVLDPFKDKIEGLLKHHKYTSVQIFQQMNELGYEGSYNTVQRFVKEIRPVERKAFFSLYFELGEAAQVDFGSCGVIPFGNIERRMSVFAMLLCHSRMLYAEFIPCERLEHFLDCHMKAFELFGGVPKRIIVDNCKCAVLSHKRGEIKYNYRYEDFASHYGFEPFACHPYSPFEKGRIENAIGYIKKNFLGGREFSNIEVANTALKHWLAETTNVRIHGTTKRKPVEVLSEELPFLQKLPEKNYDCGVIKVRVADKCCRISFDGNYYSVPQYCVGQKMTVKALPKKVVITHFEKGVVAIHTRCYDRNCTISNPDHIDGIRKQRSQIKEQNLIKDFLSLGNSAKSFLEELEATELAPRMHLRKILRLTAIYDKELIANALQDAVELKTYRYKYVEYLLNSRAKNSSMNNGLLHVPRAQDLLEIRTENPGMNQYNK